MFLLEQRQKLDVLDVILGDIGNLPGFRVSIDIPVILKTILRGITHEKTLIVLGYGCCVCGYAIPINPRLGR